MQSLLMRKLFAGLTVVGLMASPLLATAGPTGAAGKPYLGVGAEATAAPEGQPGVSVREVDPEGPAGKAGLKAGDRIEAVGDKEVKTFSDLKHALAGHKPGDPLALKVMRDGKAQSFNVTLGETPDAALAAAPPVHKSRAYLGIHAEALTADMKDQLGVTIDKGAVVLDVAPDSPAAKAGLKEKDVVVQVGDTAVTGPEELRHAVHKVGAGKDAMLKIVRGKQEMELTARLQEAPAAAAPDGSRGLPEGVESFSGSLPELFRGMEKTAGLEKKVEQLEKRVHELEQKLAK